MVTPTDATDAPPVDDPRGRKRLYAKKPTIPTHTELSITPITGPNQSGRAMEFPGAGVGGDDAIGGEKIGITLSKAAPTIPIACKSLGFEDHITPRLSIYFWASELERRDITYKLTKTESESSRRFGAAWVTLRMKMAHEEGADKTPSN